MTTSGYGGQAPNAGMKIEMTHHVPKSSFFTDVAEVCYITNVSTNSLLKHPYSNSNQVMKTSPSQTCVPKKHNQQGHGFFTGIHM